MQNILIVVPHQDDEINIASIILKNYTHSNKIYIVYTTNGDYLINQKIRYKEATKAMRVFGVNKENIIFLGYSDQPYDQNTHLYNTSGIWISKDHKKETCGTANVKEWCMRKKQQHNAQTKENLQRDLEEIIDEIKPETIIGIDLDFHPDHIMTSLLLEKALGNYLKKNTTYHPLLLKTFAYENCYLGPNDYNTIHQKTMFFNYNNGTLLSNPYYTTENSISINDICYNPVLFRNTIYKAILKHKSQNLVQHATSIINPNCVYWIRNTNNLALQSSITSTSGNCRAVNDFILCDSNDILHGDVREIKWNTGYWLPDKQDIKKELHIELPQKSNVENIVLFFNRDQIKNHICSFQIKFNNDKYGDIIVSNHAQIRLPVNQDINSITIRMTSENQVGISEIEILPPQNNIILPPCNTKRKKRKAKISDIVFNRIILTKDIFIGKIIRKILYIIYGKK